SGPPHESLPRKHPRSGGFERDSVAQGLEPANQMAPGVMLGDVIEVGGTEVGVGGACAQELVGDDEDGVRDGQWGALPPAADGAHRRATNSWPRRSSAAESTTRRAASPSTRPASCTSPAPWPRATSRP